jgi:hypothetical protein
LLIGGACVVCCDGRNPVCMGHASARLALCCSLLFFGFLWSLKLIQHGFPFTPRRLQHRGMLFLWRKCITPHRIGRCGALFWRVALRFFCSLVVHPHKERRGTEAVFWSTARAPENADVKLRRYLCFSMFSRNGLSLAFSALIFSVPNAFR